MGINTRRPTPRFRVQVYELVKSEGSKRLSTGKSATITVYNGNTPLREFREKLEKAINEIK